jgi:UDP-N-acetylglucosamine 2-epimerase (non-hydrolysing)
VLTLVFGTRPEAVKLGPIAAELRILHVPFRIIATGQHTDLLAGSPAESDLRDSTSLGLASINDPAKWLRTAVPRLENALEMLDASLVVVQGDTASALAGARAACLQELPVAHVEAGVRSGNVGEPWPEEGYRQEITRLAAYHYAASTQAYANLLAEGVNASHVRLTGNPVVSALVRYADAKPRKPEPFVVLTMHRREWLVRQQVPDFYAAVCEACREHPALDVLWPVHPAVRPHLDALSMRHHPKNLWLERPWSYETMVDTLSRACGLVTDSGGLVEEAATLGIPTAILRRFNDRPEAVEAGIAIQMDPTDVRIAIAFLAGGGLARKPTDVYGDASAASQVARHLASLSGDD